MVAQAENTSQIKNQKHNPVTHVQEPKTEKTKQTKTKQKSKKNGNINELSDLSANKRRRNPHSSPDPKEPNSRVAKGGSGNPPTRKQRSRSKMNNPTLRTFVLSQLDQYKSKDGKFNGIVRILADAGFLQLCYLAIKGKPGNMSPGTTKETLDGLTYD